MAARKAQTVARRQAKRQILDLIQSGYTIQNACHAVQRSDATYRAWRRDDPQFRKEADEVRMIRDMHRRRDHDPETKTKIGFEEWRDRFLKTKTFWHQLQWIDLVEGRDPRELHNNQTYNDGMRTRILINCPPFHAKSMTLTVDYCTYRLCMDPSYRMVIVSETQRLAKDFLFAIKQRLTHRDFIALQLAYAPEGGWLATADQWTQDRIYLGGDDRNPEEKDPNVQALGIGQQIYGSRADMVILDDAITAKNCSAWEAQLAWLRRDVASRVEMNGRVVVIGTRVASVDLYSEMMKAENYSSGKVPWTHLASPAILEEAENPDDHVTLWPHADRSWASSNLDIDECVCGRPSCAEGFEGPDGRRLYPRWDGHHLEIGPRAENNPKGWALVYQQKSTSEDATFSMHAVRASINAKRVCGKLAQGRDGHPPGGMHNMYVIGGCDPSIRKYAGLVVLAVHRETGKRYVLTVRNPKAPTPDALNKMMRELTEEFGVHEWRVERTGLLQFFTQIKEWRMWYANRGVLFKEHLTVASTKWDPQYGVASMAPLFGIFDKTTDAHGAEVDDWRQIAPPQIEIPSTTHASVRKLVSQLVTWDPDNDPRKILCDLVMALWFAEIRAREIARRPADNQLNPMRNAKRFVSARSRQNRIHVRMSEVRDAYQAVPR